MHVQIITFDGPRSAEELGASERAGRDRLGPLMQAHPDLRRDLLGGFRAVGRDNSEVLVVLARTAQAFEVMRDVVMSSELLPGEDPALLPGPTGAQRYEVAGVFGALSQLWAEADR